jgi:hypothetical protein
MNDVYNDSSSTVTFSGGSALLNVTVPGYGTAIYILSDSLKRIVVPSVTDVARAAASTMPAKFGLEQNYPNPFNPSTTIRFAIPAAGMVSLKIYDVLGREVSGLVNSTMQAGSYQVQWNAVGMPSGMYVYELRAGSFVDMKRMMVVK